MLKDVTSVADARAAIPVGLTMDQVRERAGNPMNVSTQNEITTWEYLSGSGAINAQSLIPIVGALAPQQSRAKAVVVTFNAAGRVQKVEYIERTTGGL